MRITTGPAVVAVAAVVAGISCRHTDELVSTRGETGATRGNRCSTYRHPGFIRHHYAHVRHDER
jgi:hypothetical protein